MDFEIKAFDHSSLENEYTPNSGVPNPTPNPGGCSSCGSCGSCCCCCTPCCCCWG